MKEAQIQSSRRMLREKLWAYLKAEGVEHNEHSCRCPTPDCGGRAAIRCAAEGTLQPLPAWHCPVCGRGGDTVDAALALHPQLDESGAIRQVRRALHLPITHLDSISAEELMGMRFKRKHWLIENLLGPGLYLLAGPSKIGKSWMVLYMADRISRGEPVWDMRSTRSEVLYISLEDTPERLQKRLQAITDGTVGPVYLATEAELIGAGFEAQLENFLREHEATKLIIVDTFQKIRRLGSEQYSYAGDYATMGALKRIADQRGVTILLVHHNRKMQSDDPMDMLSGTTGIAGASDGTLILQKRSRLGTEATLTVMGRDAPDQQLRLNFDRETKLWQLLGRGQDPEREETDRVFALAAELAEACGGSWEGTASQLLEALELEGETSASGLSARLTNHAQQLLRDYGLRVSTHRTREKRLLRLQLEGAPCDARDARDADDADIVPPLPVTAASPAP